MTTDQAGTDQAGVLETLRDLPRYTRFALLGVFVNQVGTFVQAFMVLFLVQRGFGEAEAGIALGAYALGGIAGTFGGGWLSDRLGTRLTIAGAVAGASAMTVSITVLPTIEAIVVAVFLGGALTLVSRPAMTTLLLRSAPRARQVMVQAMFRTALNGGAALGPLLAAGLSAINWNLVFYVDAVTAVLYGVIALYLFPRRDQELAPAGTAPSRPDAAYRTILRDRRYLGYLLMMFVNGVIHIQVFVVLPIMLVGAGLPIWVYSVTITCASVVVITTELLVTKVTQRWPIWVAVLVGWLLLVAGRGAYGLFELVSGLALGAVLAVLAGAATVSAFGQVVGGPAAFAYPARVARREHIGSYVGSAQGAFQVGYTVGPMVGAALWLQLGGPFWAVVAVVGLAMSVVLVWSMRPPDRPDAEAAARADQGTVPTRTRS